MPNHINADFAAIAGIAIGIAAVIGGGLLSESTAIKTCPALKNLVCGLLAGGAGTGFLSAGVLYLNNSNNGKKIKATVANFSNDVWNAVRKVMHWGNDRPQYQPPNFNEEL